MTFASNRSLVTCQVNPLTVQKRFSLQSGRLAFPAKFFSRVAHAPRCLGMPCLRQPLKIQQFIQEHFKEFRPSAPCSPGVDLLILDEFKSDQTHGRQVTYVAQQTLDALGYSVCIEPCHIEGIVEEVEILEQLATMEHPPRTINISSSYSPISLSAHGVYQIYRQYAWAMGKASNQGLKCDMEKMFSCQLNTLIAQSIQAYCTFTEAPQHRFQPRIQTALRMLAHHGTCVVMSSGNTRQVQRICERFHIQPPQSYEQSLFVNTSTSQHVFVVGSSQGNLGSGSRAADFSIMSPWVDVAINGENVAVGPCQRASGTSFSAAQVSALLSVLSQINPQLSPGERFDIIRQTVTPLAQKNPSLGAGIVEPKLAIAQAYRSQRTALTKGTLDNDLKPTHR